MKKAQNKKQNQSSVKNKLEHLLNKKNMDKKKQLARIIIINVQELVPLKIVQQELEEQVTNS